MYTNNAYLNDSHIDLSLIHISMLMINSGAMQNTLAALPAESANQTVSQLSALWTTPAPLFFISGIERISAIILHIGLSLLIYRAVKAGKCRTAAFTAVLAYGIQFIVEDVYKRQQ